ncbi:MAG: helix-turn-helix domain-containing protein [Planctomycetota bacterium]
MNEHRQKTTERLLLTSGEAAKALGICERTLFGLTKSGELSVIRIGRAVRYSVEDLKAWIRQASQKGMTDSREAVE